VFYSGEEKVLNAAIPAVNKNTDSRGWLAKFDAEFYSVDGHTKLGRTEHFGPLRVQRPFFPEGPECLHLYLLHPPGGLVGGDQLSISLHAKGGSHFLLTTPSAGKLYRNISGLSQGQHVEIRVDDGAIVEYLPQENIVFDGAEGDVNTTVQLSGNAVFCGWDITCLGRYESADPFQSGSLKQSLHITRNGLPLFIDRFQLNAPSRLQHSLAGFHNKWVFGTFVITLDLFPNDQILSSEQQVLADKITQWISAFSMQYPDLSIAITQKPGVWLARAMGDRAEKIRTAFEFLWSQLRPYALGRPVSVPRIWRT